MQMQIEQQIRLLKYICHALNNNWDSILSRMTWQRYKL